MRIIEGNLIVMAQAGEFDLIVHGCNCFNTFGKGIARQIKDAFPLAWLTDKRTIKGSVNKLGTVGFVRLDRGLVVANAYTQHDYRGRGRKTSYKAVRDCFRQIGEYAQKNGPLKIGYPRIGAGLGGGSWNLISKIINSELSGKNHTLVEWSSR